MTASGPLFPLGRTVATPGVLCALEEAVDDLAEFFARHERGDWGEVDEDGRKQNNLALRIGTRIISVYRTSKGVEFYIITEEESISDDCTTSGGLLMSQLLENVRTRLASGECEEGSTFAHFHLRLVREPMFDSEEPKRFTVPLMAARTLHSLLDGVDREVLGALLLDTRKGILGVTIAYIGTLNHIKAEPRGLIVPALLANAAGIMAFHNHPSGDPAPSPEDMAFNKQLHEACELLKLNLVDHIILGKPPTFVSLRERNAW